MIIYLTIFSVILLSFGLICWLKGKYWSAALCPLPGAVRLARPESWWARQFYANFPEKMNRATVRYAGRKASNKWLALSTFILLSTASILYDALAPYTNEAVTAPKQEEQAQEATDVPEQEQTPEATPEPTYPKTISVYRSSQTQPDNRPVYVVIAIAPESKDLDIRSDHSAKSTVIEKLRLGDQVFLEDGRIRNDDPPYPITWQKVTTMNGATGWIDFDYLAPSDTNPPTPSGANVEPIATPTLANAFLPAKDTNPPTPSGANVEPVATPTPANAFLPAKSSSPNASKVSGWSTDHLMKRRAELVQRFKDDSFGIYFGVMRWVSHAIDKGKAKEEFRAIGNELNRRGIRVSTEIPKKED
jgi:hypothetical protein